jgi:hypothetical protein
VWHAKVAVSIHRGSDGSGLSRVASHAAGVAPVRRPIVPYSDDRVAFGAALVAVVAFGIYLRTMLPATGFWDTGEAQTVPATLSIFHPTGFPTFTLLGWLWTHAIPIGEVAWRMNLLSGVSVALASGVVVLIAGHLVEARHRGLAAGSAAVAGAAFAFAAEPWENATRADVHALNVLFTAAVIWLLLVWSAARRSGSPLADRWLMGAALVFGIGLGNHPLLGMLSIGIVFWLFMIEPAIWRRWRLVAACAGLLALGLVITYAYIPIRALTDPEPPLFYARPDTLERLRYLVFAEQFRNLFDELSTPFADLGAKWRDASPVLERQFFGPGWLLVAVGAATMAARRRPAWIFLVLVAAATIVYAMNFRDGDIHRYYLPVVVAAAPLLGVAVAAVASASAVAVVQAGRRLGGTAGRRRLASAAAATVLLMGAGLPLGSLVTQYQAVDASEDRDADRWVESVHAVLPPNAVVISWWSYSTPLWYHRWVLGEWPDVTIIDERNILDDGYRTMARAIRAHLGDRPVYVVPPHWDYTEITRRWETTTIHTYPGYIDLLLIEGPG